MSHIVTYLTHQPLIDKRLVSSQWSYFLTSLCCTVRWQSLSVLTLLYYCCDL